MVASEHLLPSQAHALLASTFGHERFQPGQQAAVTALLAGHDVQVLLPTGGGKSLCYQLPALMARAAGSGTTIVISPLIALMDDQVARLRRLGIAAAALHSAQDELVQRAAMGDFISGRLDIVYASPERAVLSGFRAMAARAKVAFLAIDEAHCISQWGHDFRPEYLRLGELRLALGVPTMALTATATPLVMQEIASALGLNDPIVIRGGFVRPNLRFSALELGNLETRLAALTNVVAATSVVGPGNTVHGRVLIYCATRKRVERVAATLTDRGWPVGHYHAGRSERARARAQQAYENGRKPILVATNAFGMGIDHPDVRLLVHFDMPGSVEAYYQEAGRAGRDAAAAECVLFFGKGDLVTQRLLARGSANPTQRRHRETLLTAMLAYAHATTCRQQVIATYFGDPQSANGCAVCDVCRPDPTRIVQRAERNVVTPPTPTPAALVRAELDSIVQAAQLLKRPVGKAVLARALRGSRARPVSRSGLCDTPVHGSLRHLRKVDLIAAIEQLIVAGELERRGRKYPTVWLAGRAVRPRREGGEPGAGKKHTRRDASHSVLWRALDNYRRRTARSFRWKVYMVFSGAVIDAIDRQQPDSLWALTQVRGLGPMKIERFGTDILALVKTHAASCGS